MSLSFRVVAALSLLVTLGCQKVDEGLRFGQLECGNMIIETYDGQTEQCDDGTENSDSEPDACRSDCTLARCGDGVIDSAEICDDGNQAYGDGCNPKCKPFECGDGIVEAPEECDGGELNSNTGSCTLECRDARCGDGFIQEGVERCDDGDAGNSDTLADRCRTNCQPASCGDGILDSGEECDDGNGDPTDGCNNQCFLAVCGDGQVEGDEACDDGNTVTEACPYGEESCTVCASDCSEVAGETSFCGDESLDASEGETCDEGSANTESCAYGIESCQICNLNCQEAEGQTALCGDGTINGPEGCDDGNLGVELCPYNAPSCSVCGPSCTLVSGILQFCGDGAVQTAQGEECDLGAENGNGTCTLECELTEAVCGDGVLSDGEACDDGNTETEVCAYGEESCIVCDASCANVVGATSRCGDGIVDSIYGETCDDGNDDNTDGCLNACQVAKCGDGVVQVGVEACDDANENDFDACLSDCTTAACGDGILHEGFEVCDDGNASDTDECLGNCVEASCGDGFIQAGFEFCDEGSANTDTYQSDGTERCNADCTALAAYCGDGVQNGTESCDDGNDDNTDGCLNTCEVASCGDGFVQAGVEACDDGNTDNTDNCVLGCQAAVCGDGVVQAGIEGCDDGNTEDDATCNANCTVPGCGDGVVQDPEVCDDGNQDNTDGCTTLCEVAVCGDGFMQTVVEACDDGNTVTEACAYGEESCTVCASGCVLEAGEVSSCGDDVVNGPETCDDGNAVTEVCAYGQESCTVCNASCQNAAGAVSVCGDGIINGPEECDDGNDDNTDGCLNSCLLAECGDGVVQAGVEACDDGNLNNTDDCLNNCVAASCGDGFVQNGVEACDDANQDNTDNCLNSCIAASCGDGYVQVDVETCDDGDDNTDNYQLGSDIFCLTTCDGYTGYCGDNVVNGPEECDDADTDDTDACPSTCLDATCGDGFVLSGVEACDDGNQSNVDACLTTCEAASCGDGYVLDGTEACDDGDTVQAACVYGETACTVCSATCTSVAGEVSYCGDSVLDAAQGEVCEDGGTVAGDGCSATCQDENECDDGTDNCSDNAACTNTVGSFTCACDDGFSGDGVACDDIDECSTGTAGCDADATCANTAGSYTCTCNAGFTGDGLTCLSSANDLLGFSFEASLNAGLSVDYDGTVNGTEVGLTLPSGTDRSALVASFSVSPGASVTLTSASQTSGVSINDFRNMLTYTVTAEDGTASDYTVNVAGDGWVQEAYIKAPNADASDLFGRAVAIDGDTVVVGAEQEDSSQSLITNGNTASTDNSAANAGAAYVFVRDGTAWSQQAYLKASNAGGYDVFGSAVAIDGDTVVVGSKGDDSSQTTITNGSTSSNDEGAGGSGAAFVFVRDGVTWSQQAYLKASNAEAGDNLGSSVALSGDTIVVGASHEDSSQTTITHGGAASSNNEAERAGSAYVFVREGETWEEQAYLKASNADIVDLYGARLSVDGDTIVVATPLEDSDQTSITNGDTSSADNSASGAGAAYVYVRTGETWSQQAYLKASNAEANDQFAYTVTISGDTIAVGAPGEDSAQSSISTGDTASDDNSAERTGAAYVFVRESNTWRQEAYLKSSNNTYLSNDDYFGTSVALENDTLVVGASGEDSSGTSIIYGSFAGDDNDASGAGAAYVFVRESGLWRQQAYLKAANAESDDFFGAEVGVSGDTIVVAATGEDSNQTTITHGPTASDDNSLSNSGAVYVFRSWEAECGNGIVDQGEDCDDGNAIDDGDGCSETCVFNPVCGDGIVQSLFETCDDGASNTDAWSYAEQCNSTCDGSNSYCGDGIKNGSEQCDDGDSSNSDWCSTSCTFRPETVLGSCFANGCTITSNWGIPAYVSRVFINIESSGDLNSTNEYVVFSINSNFVKNLSYGSFSSNNQEGVFVETLSEYEVPTAYYTPGETMTLFFDATSEVGTTTFCSNCADYHRHRITVRFE